jgi:hypothetical protein
VTGRARVDTRASWPRYSPSPPVLPIIFNLPGLAMIAAGMVVAFTWGHLKHVTAEPLLMIILGMVAGTLDLAYRYHRAQAEAARRASVWERVRAMGFDWIRPSTGGSLFYAPVWWLGVLWIALGAARMARGG